MNARRRRWLVVAPIVVVAILAVSVALAWDTHVANGMIELGWMSVYLDNPLAGSLPTSGWSGNEHTELSHVALSALGVQNVFGMEPLGSSNTIVVDLNAALYQTQVLTEEDFGDNPTTALEERVVPPPPHFSGLPDYSYALHDWINKNTLCPLPDEAPAKEYCHEFVGWMGALNANHFGTQAQQMYQRYHLIALALAQRAKSLREALAMSGSAADAEAHAIFVKEAELEALIYEGVGQHFLGDRWAVGHMWERWNGADYPTSAPLDDAGVVAAASGLLHGSQGITGLADPMSSPALETMGGTTTVAPVRWRIGRQEPQPGVGDYRLEDMHDGMFGFEFGLPDRPFSVSQQQSRMMACAKAGWAEVIQRFGEVSPGHYGEHDVTLTGGPFTPVLEQKDCWNAWATNSAIATGWLEHQAAADVSRVARTFMKLTGPNGEVVSRMVPVAPVSWKVISRALKDDPDSTYLARGGIGPYVYEVQGVPRSVPIGKGFPVPDYTEPVNLDSLPHQSTGILGRDKHTLYGFFNRAHADYWCQDLQGTLFNLRGSAVPIEREACAYLADRAYKGTDPAYVGPQIELRRFMDEEIDPICQYYGVVTAGVNEDLPYFLHPGYVDEPSSQGHHSFKSLENWCARVPVVDRMLCPGPAPEDGSDTWDVVARAFESGGTFLLHGSNFGDGGGTVKVGSVEDTFPITLPAGDWTDTQIEVNLTADLLTAGDWFLEVCPAGMPAPPCSVGRFVLRIGEGGGASLHSGFDAGVEGWTQTGASSFSAPAGGGNPGGYLHIDNSEGPITYIFASAAFQGNLSDLAGGTVSFDGNMLGIGGGNYASDEDYGHLRITGTGGSATADLVPMEHTGSGVGNPPKNTWTTFSASLDAASFNTGGASFSTILSNVTEIRLSVEALFGAEVQGIDNFRMTAVGGDVCTKIP